MIKFLYKYTKLRADFFEEPMLRATPVSELNDPFEGRFNKDQVTNATRHHEQFYKDAGINGVQELDEYQIDEIMSAIECDFSELGVISFTEDHINPLMWAHYADEHKGMVIQFKTGVPLFSDSFQYIDGIDGVVLSRFGESNLGDFCEFPERVVYRRETPSFEHKEDVSPESLHEFHWKKFNKSIFFTKANDWIYEKESRSVVRLKDADRIICENNNVIRKICSDNPEIELTDLPNGSIQITYPNGYEMNEEMGDESVKNEIFMLSIHNRNPPIHLFRIDPECIRGVYFGYKADYSSCLEKIRNNEKLNHLTNLNKMEIKSETYSLFASKLDQTSDTLKPHPHSSTMSEIKDQPIQQFLDELASKSATPGGGSAAAIMGAQGAALISMVCNLTIGKPKFVEVEADMQALLNDAETLREQLTDMIKADIDVFNRVMAAYGLPKETDAEKTARSAAIQAVMKDATDVPLDCAKACAKVIALSQIAADKGNPNVISDAGAGLMAAYGGLKIAALNVYINAGSLKDREFADAKLAELAAIMQTAENHTNTLYQVIQTKL